VRRQNPVLNAGGLWERGVNGDPGSSQEKIPSHPAGEKLSSAEAANAPVRVIRTPQVTPKRRYTGLELWLHRVTVLMFVFVCAAVGVLLVILPWRPEWTDNYLLLGYPGLRTFLSNGFVRGLCSGLGMLDIWIGFWEAIHYHEGMQL
jgi:hypothetical protein